MATDLQKLAVAMRTIKKRLPAGGKRYDRVVEMARESRCTCNSSRNLVDVARDICDYLLADDPPVKLGRDLSLIHI